MKNDIKIFLTIYKNLFALYLIVPLISIGYKLLRGNMAQVLYEVWFISVILILIGLIYIIKLSKQVKNFIASMIVITFVLFFGLGAIGFQTKYIIVDFSDMDILSRLPYIVMFVILCIQLLCLVLYKYFIDRTVYKKD